MLKVRIVSAASKATAVAVPVAQGGLCPPGARRAVEVTGFVGRTGETCDLRAMQPRMLLVGLGDQSNSAGRAAGAVAAAHLGEVARIAIDARGLTPALATELAVGASLRSYRPSRRRLRPDQEQPALRNLDLLVDTPKLVRPAWTDCAAALAGNKLARDLVTEPANMLTPASLAARLRRLSRHGVTVEILKGADLRRAELGGLLAVGRGAVNRPRLVVLRWAGDGQRAPLVLIGKGITFDTGGICVKPADRMWEMRADMAGAAACAGAVLAAALRRSAASIVAVLPLAENAIGADSYRPGDVLRMRGGSTVEVVDTDAEGRLVLADALAYAVETMRPQALVDIATLTGSIVVALGNAMAGMFDNDERLARDLEAAAKVSGELLWRMPIGRRHRSDLDSEIADIRHCVPERMQPDASHAAAFLRTFVGDVPWVHLDIAGMESRDEADDQHAAGATGFGVRLLDRLIASRFER